MPYHHRHRNYRGGGRPNPLVYVLIVVLTVLLAGLLYYDHAQEEKNSERLRILAQEELERWRQMELEREKQKASDSFYQKLADGFDVNILIVGDSIGAGAGATEYDLRWANLMAANIRSTYGVKVNLTNVSMGGNSSYAGYVRTMALNDGIDYDLAVLCYGQNDSPNNFSLYYESIIRALKNRYPSTSIMCVLESSQRDYTEKIQIIQALADHYGVPVVDTIAPFQTKYDIYVNDDGVHPNDEGYRIYSESVMTVIDSLVAKRHAHDPNNVTVVNDRVTVLDTFQWYGADKFTRKGNTFLLKTSTNGIILGIDYIFTSGANSCKILIDGIEYAAPEVYFNYDFSQRYIMVVNNWLEGDTVNIQREIKVVFSEDESGKNQADGFKGIAIS